jgi:hypothetical protein
MMLGLWEDTETLRTCYAHLTPPDRRARMARYIPAGATAPSKERGKRERSAAAALTVLSKLLEKNTNAYEARRYLKDLHRHFEEIDQTIAGELGLVWEPADPNPFREGEIALLDAALRERGYQRGIAAVLGREVLPEEMLRKVGEVRAADPSTATAFKTNLRARLQPARVPMLPARASAVPRAPAPEK